MTIKAILTDIEGTTSSLSFVKDVLFPYAREHIAAFVRDNSSEEKVVQQLDAVRSIEGEALDIEDIIEKLHQWIDTDQKITPLKTLQGLLWEKGYRDGDFKGHVYEDAYLHLKQWHESGIQLFVYSSGSIYAQKLLFGYSDFGDMTPLFSGYFDTTSGFKQEASSYENITTAIGLSAEEILFLSDIEQELDAAKEAGMQTCWLVREGKTEATSHQQVTDFNQIAFD